MNTMLVLVLSVMVILFGGVLVSPATAAETHRVAMVDAFVIGAFIGPPPEEFTEARFAEIKAAGIDMVVTWHLADADNNRKALALAQKAGLRLIVRDDRVRVLAGDPNLPLNPETFRQVVADYRGFDSLGAYAFWDEPRPFQFGRLAEISQAFRAIDPDHEPYVNLFPGYADNDQLGGLTFAQYVRTFIETVKPGILCYDHYTLSEDPNRPSTWYQDLRLMRQEARRAGIPLWLYVQSEGIKNMLRVPNAAEVAWQANTALAYGVRAILWFTYWNPSPPLDQIPADFKGEIHYEAMIGADGKKTAVYDHVQKANAFLHVAGPALIGWDNVAVTHVENGLVTYGECPIAKFYAAGKLVVGTFLREKTYRLVIANDSYTHPAKVTINPIPGLNLTGVIAQINARIIATTLEMEPGGCVVVEFTPNP